MNELPSGTVTFLFTDIEGSTRLAQEYPDAIAGLMSLHDEMLIRSVQSHHGQIFQDTGDGYCAAFASATDAVRAALEAQILLHNQAWKPAPVKVRMGLHTGTVSLDHNGEYSGYTTLALTQRVMSAGHGGQILLSGATRELVRDFLPAGSELVDLGERRLKDLQRPEHLYQLHGSGLSANFPPLKTLDLFPNNLPTQLTTFIGREKEMMEIKQELTDHRLVTLTGAGGTGKTRLSLQVAAELLDQFPQGIWFVELAPLTDPDLIPQTLLATIGIGEQAGRPPLDLLTDYLRSRKSLIVLDNCEHLIESSARVANTLLNAAPGLRILASSREALGIKGEVSYPVPSLSSPDLKHLPVVEQLSQYESVRLFIDRAILISPHFVVDRENAPAIAQICYRLDGIPLAIELAAARVKMMSVDQISKRLDDRFRLLTGGARTALPRQQTLRALIDWSYDILAESERLLLRRLSVFAGGWTLEAAEAVCVGEGIDVYDVLDLLSQLVNKSLAIVVEDSQADDRVSIVEGPRYRMLETIRQYAREKLLEAGEGEKIRKAHFDYYLQMGRKILPELFGPRELDWLLWLDQEWDNLRGAVEWSFETHPDDGLELVNCLGYLYLDNLNNLTDFRTWFQQFLDHPVNSTRTSRRARGLLHAAWYANAGYESTDRVRDMVIESISIYEELGDRNGLAHGYLSAALATNNVQSGKAYFEKALFLFQETNDKVWMAFGLLYFGWLIELQDYERKRDSLEKSLALYRELGFITGTIEALKQLGALAIRVQDFELAHSRLEEGQSIMHQYARHLANAITMSYDLGDLAYYEGRYELAQFYFGDALAWAEQKCAPLAGGWAKVRLGYLYTRRGEIQSARSYYQQALAAFRTGGVRIGIIFTVEGLAGLAASERQWDKAARLFSWAATQREKSGELRPPVEQTAVKQWIASICEHLTTNEFTNFTEDGSAMTMEQAIALAEENTNV